MPKRLMIATSLLLGCLGAQAEYRAYQYLVKPKNSLSMVTEAEAKIIITSLSPQTFIAYNGGQSSIDVTLMRTWMCAGGTAKKVVCPHPSERLQ
jgi:hypothetical protein